MNGRLRFVRDDDGTSPIIGILLILAIMVVLAGVINVFVLNLGGDVKENIKAGASVSTTDAYEIRVAWNSNQNAKSLTVSFHSDECGAVDSTRETLSNVGDTYTSSSCTIGDTVTVIVTANGDADAKSVILNKDIDV